MEYKVACPDLAAAVRVASALSRETGQPVEIETHQAGEVVARQVILAEGGGK